MADVYSNRCDLFRANDCTFNSAYNLNIYQPSNNCEWVAAPVDNMGDEDLGNTVELDLNYEGCFPPVNLRI